MMLVWFPWIALKGLPWVIRQSRGLSGDRPLVRVPVPGRFPQIGLFVILGVVVLAITGAEAKYADIGHFARRGETEVHDGQSIDPQDSGRRPVMYLMVLPCPPLPAAQLRRTGRLPARARGPTPCQHVLRPHAENWGPQC